MNDEKQNFQIEAIKWLFEAELLDDPRVIHTLKMNVFVKVPRVKEMEFLIAGPPKRQILVYAETSWFTKKFFGERTCGEVKEVIQQFFPKYQIRVITDEKILQLAQKKVKEYLQCQ